MRDGDFVKTKTLFLILRHSTNRVSNIEKVVLLWSCLLASYMSSNYKDMHFWWALLWRNEEYAQDVPFNLNIHSTKFIMENNIHNYYRHPIG